MTRIAILLLLLAFSARADEFDTLRAKWKDIIVGTGYDTNDTDVASKLASIATAANKWSSTMDTSPTRTYLWSDLTSTTVSAQVTTMFERLRAMALAYATPGCSLQGDAALLANIIDGLDWMNANRYGATAPANKYDNWWDWEIGSPIQLTDTCVLLYDQLDATRLTNYMNAVERWTPTPTGTQANLVMRARAVGVRGCLVKDGAKITLCRDAFSDAFPYVTIGDGFYTDGGFIQHEDTPYTASYGAELLKSMAPTMIWLSGSTWAITDPTQSNLYSWIFDSFEPIIYNGSTWDLVRGRDAGRDSSASAQGHGIMDSILQIAQFAPAADALRMKSMIKGWAQRDNTRNFVSGRGLSTLMLAKSLMSDTNVAPRGELLGHYNFGSMDRVVHLGAGYGFGLAMHSTRIANFEGINSQNLKGWFTGDGQTTIFNGDLNAFADSYACTVDAYHLPGVTSDSTLTKPPAKPNLSAGVGLIANGQGTLSPYSWVGGATLGRFGAAGMQFKSYDATLTGKKSWFMFDDEIVCLGAGITSTDSRLIETTIEQRKLNSSGNNTFTVNGSVKSTTLGWTETMGAVNWAHLAGNVAGSDIGYYFPTNPTLTGLREARTGALIDIDATASTNKVTRNYLRITLEHGNNPTNATYQYVLLPGRNATRTGLYAAAPQVTVLTNSPDVQAVTESTLGITAANFWTDTVQTVGGITCNKKASVLVRNDGAFIDVSVSDPTQLNTGTIDLQIALDGVTLASASAGVTVTQSTPSIAMSVSTADAAGKTFKARFYKLTPQTVNITPVADSYVYDAASSANANFGTATSLIVKKAGKGFNREAYLRFNVPSTNAVFLGAALKLACLSATKPGVHAVAKVDDTTWGETTITWNNRPAAGALLDIWTPATNATSSADVTDAVPTSGLVSFKVYATTQTTDGYVTYGSRENSTTNNRPQLALIYGHTPPDVTLTAPVDGATLGKPGNVTITAEVTPTDGAVTNVVFYDGATLLGTDNSLPYSISSWLDRGTHNLTAVATDANGLSRTSIVTRLNVAVVHPPVASSGTFTTPPGAPIDIDLHALASDVETPAANLKLQLGKATNGTVAFLPDGHTVRFTPASGYRGPASFSYTVTDTTREDRTVLNYNFQDSDFTDSSGQGYNGALTLQGTNTNSYASAYAFTNDSPFAAYSNIKSLVLAENGSNAAARIDSTLDTNAVDLQNGSWTFTGWFKRKTTNNIDVIAQLGDGGGYGPSTLVLAHYGTNSSDYHKLELRNYDNSTPNSVKIMGFTNANVATNTWHHFAVARSSNVLSFYLDGKIAATNTNFIAYFNNTSTVKWGGAKTFPDRCLNGSLADLAFFNAALNATDIAKLTNSPVQWFGGLTATNTVAINVITPIDDWRQTYFGTTNTTGIYANTADKDNDGFSNLLEYACGTDPNTADGPPFSTALNATGIDYFYTKNKSATDVSCIVEWCDDLATPGSWTTSGVSAPAILDDNGWVQLLQLTVPCDASVTKRFVRLRVTQP